MAGRTVESQNRKQKKDLKKYVVEHLKELLEEEISEAGERLAKAIVAEDEDLMEAASCFREIAHDEARHATLIATLIAEEGFWDTRSNVISAIDADSHAAQREREFVEAAKKAGMGDAARLFEELSEDEKGHVKDLEELLKNLR